MIKKCIQVVIASFMLCMHGVVLLVAQVPAPEMAPGAAPAPAPEGVPAAIAPAPAPAPDVAVAAAPAPAPTPGAPAPAAAPAPVAAPAAPIAEVPKPVWPDTVELDKAFAIVEGGDPKMKKELFDQSKDVLKQVNDAVMAVEEIKNNGFKEFLRVQKMVRDFVFDTNSKLGKIKEDINQ